MTDSNENKASEGTKEAPKAVTPLEYGRLLGNDLMNLRDKVIEFGGLFQKALNESVEAAKKLEEASDKSEPGAE